MPPDQPFWVKQWALAIDAPLPFAACVIAAIGVIWLLVNWSYGREIDALRQQVAAADQNMKLFKDQIPTLEQQIQDVQQSVQRGDSYAAIRETTADAVITAEALRSLQSELLIPVRNGPPKKVATDVASKPRRVLNRPFLRLLNYLMIK
jgi:hypothetical protein